MEKKDWREIQEELDRLYELHENGVSNPGNCRKFNSQTSAFLQRLEELGAEDVADQVMQILGGCSPKDFSPCDNRLNTKGALERLRERIKARLK
jgi:hypothetical protein